MPLIIICGCPVSGKTTRAKELKEYFETAHKKQVEIISEEDAITKLGYEHNATYLDSQKEKRVRGYLKSEVLKLIGKDNVVILDGSNYIKGYRYELYCASKASKCTQCTVFTIRNHQEAWESNLTRLSSDPPETAASAYSEEVFNALTKFRFEEPNCNNRWDSPLFTVQPQDKLDLEAVYSALFEKKPPPPNQSTQNPPLSATNFLYELDKVTQSISKQILESRQINPGSEIRFPEYPGCILESGAALLVTPQGLLRLRRQFLTFAKMNHANEKTDKIGRYFIQYLNKTMTD
ncbi:protein KTI12 homolog [Choristoneura fumiferana]|uniref:protein KTI12 homolog n=1 Tax=Choristoneura fumiferana TaxID=7141 RepID=UPI003D15C25C